MTTVDIARDLGMVIDSHLTMSAQVGAVCQSTYNYLRQLRPVVRALSVQAKKTVVQAFVSSRLDYCNSLLSGVTDSLVHVFKMSKMLPRASLLTFAGARISRQY